MVYGLQPPRHEIAARIGNKGLTAIDGVTAAILTKLVVEQEIGYVTNGAFIAAAVHCGFDFKIEPDSPNPYFNMSKKSIQQTKGYKKRYSQ